MVAKVYFECDKEKDASSRFVDLMELAKDFLGAGGVRVEWWNDSAIGLWRMDFSGLDMAQAQDVLEMFLGNAYTSIDKKVRDAYFFLKKVEFTAI